jgi:hypothetical protein
MNSSNSSKVLSSQGSKWSSSWSNLQLTDQTHSSQPQLQQVVRVQQKQQQRLLAVLWCHAAYLLLQQQQQRWVLLSQRRLRPLLLWGQAMMMS